MIAENPGLTLPSPYPIRVAHRVAGSSSTASITEYLNQVCPEEWPADLVGSIIEWPSEGTVGCEGSGGMTECITSTPGTIGYIDSGHGHAEGLQEIELLNADSNYISSKEAAAAGGIMAAADNAELPSTLDGNFADVNLLNRPGPNTWPIAAVSYIYVRQDLTFIENPASQTLLKAFLKAVYTDEYITQCEEEFGFVRVAGELRSKALAAIDALTITPGAPEWIFEFNTETRIGQGDYVISVKRDSYSEIEQGDMLDRIATLEAKTNLLELEIEELHQEMDGVSHSHDGGAMVTGSNAFQIASEKEEKQDTQLMAALVMSSISFAFWGIAGVMLLARAVTGKHDVDTQMHETAKPAMTGELP